jgi:hypothetical protein
MKYEGINVSSNRQNHKLKATKNKQIKNENFQIPEFYAKYALQANSSNHFFEFRI